MPCAKGERQILPKQTTKILVFDGFEGMNYSNNYRVNFLDKSSTYFLNCLSVEDKLSTVLQA